MDKRNQDPFRLQLIRQAKEIQKAGTPREYFDPASIEEKEEYNEQRIRKS